MRFDYERPSTVEQAVALLADRDRRGIPVAFGSDLLVQTKRRAREPGTVVDLTGIDELRALDEQEDGLFLGAALPLGEIGRAPALARFPALRAAVATMGSAQLREGASIGGNVCTASPAGDSGPPLLAYEARMVLAGPGGRRDLAAGEFYLGPGRCAVETTEVLVGLRLPWPRPGSVGTYLKGARRRAVDLALVSVAAVAWPSSEMPSGLEARVALGAVAPTPVRAEAVEALVRAGGLGLAPGRVAEATGLAARPIDDVRATASYRLALVGHLVSKALGDLAGRLAEAAR